MLLFAFIPKNQRSLCFRRSSDVICAISVLFCSFFVLPLAFMRINSVRAFSIRLLSLAIEVSSSCSRLVCCPMMPFRKVKWKQELRRISIKFARNATQRKQNCFGLVRLKRCFVFCLVTVLFPLDFAIKTKDWYFNGLTHLLLSSLF